MNSQNRMAGNGNLDGPAKAGLPFPLDRTPAAEVLVGTAAAWAEALTADRAWDQVRDTPTPRAFRVRDAGENLPPLACACRVHRGVAVIRATGSLVRESRVASPEVRASNIRRIAAMLDGTYTDRKRAAGGDQ